LPEISFTTQMRELERRFAALAADERDVYLPNPTPAGPVDAVLIAMEPSLGRWARAESPEAVRNIAQKKIAAGVRNFMPTGIVLILHYAVRRFLCDAGETYYITDISKGAMLGKKANADRSARYKRWADLLVEELQIVAKPNARLIAIGQQVGDFLTELGIRHDAIMHYSPVARAKRNAQVNQREAEFRAFAATLSMSDLIDVATEVLEEQAIPTVLRDEMLAQLHGARLSESDKKLAFIYSTVFATLRAAGKPAALPGP
jgi:hypothetical protein